MEPLMQDKREVATLVPYRMRGTEPEFYLQMRALDAPTSPDRWGIFGGGLESGEEKEDALLREIEEELRYVPKKHVFFSTYEHAKRINYVYIEEVDENFESHVEINNEAQYGRFLTEAEVMDSPKAGTVTRLIISQLSKYLSKNQIWLNSR